MVPALVNAQVSESEQHDARGAYAGKTVYVGSLALRIRSDASEHFGAGDMPTLTFLKDADGRDVSIVTDKGDAVADIRLKANGHADLVTLGNGLKLHVVAQGEKKYEETLIGRTGKVLKDRIIDPTRRKGAEPLVLDPVARQLGLSAKWRDEVTIEALDSTSSVVKQKSTGKTLLYVVRDGPNKVGFDAQGNPLYYEVMAQFYSGRADVNAEYADLQGLIPDRFIYTRDGQIGAYVYTPAVTGIYAFWTEKDASGATIVQFRAGDGGTGPAGGKSVSPTSTTGATANGRHLRSTPMDYCIIEYQG